MPSVELTHVIGDAKVNAKGETGVVTAITVKPDLTVDYVVTVPEANKHVTRAKAAVDIWFTNVLSPHWDDVGEEWKDTAGLEKNGKPTLAFFADRFGKLKDAIAAALV